MKQTLEIDVDNAEGSDVGMTYSLFSDRVGVLLIELIENDCFNRNISSSLKIV